MTAVVIPFKQPELPPEPTAEQLRLRIQEIAKDTSRLQLDIPHFQHRLRQKDLSMRHVLETIRGGTAVSEPVLDKFGDWRLKLRRLVAGRRVHVVVAIGKGDTVAVITGHMRMGSGMAREQYHYTESGLDFVYLIKGFDLVKGPGGQRRVVIHNMDGLHRAIGKFLVEERGTLSGKEVKFLRNELLLSQSSLGAVLGVTEQTVRRWEHNDVPIPRTADTALRGLYMEHIGGNANVTTTLQKIADLDDEIDRLNLLLEETSKGWVAKECEKEAA